MSLSTLIWEIFVFLMKTSYNLRTFIEAETKLITPQNELSKAADDLILAITELPLYFFGEVHPLHGKGLVLEVRNDVQYSPLQGAIGSPWDPADLANCQIGYWAYRYNGDGVTRSMAIELPKQLKLFNI